MLDVLAKIEPRLPELLADAGGWSSLDVDYHPPRVERLYRSVGAYRVNLHCIHPCQPGTALFHPHPWPSAMRVLQGRYEMAVGYGPGDKVPEIAATFIVEGSMRYEMIAPDAWHWVRPIDGLVWTVMVTGAPWGRSGPIPTRSLSPLPAARITEMIARFGSLL